MTRSGLFGRRWLTAGLLALAAIAIGAIFGSFHNGSAAIALKPTNVNPPTIAGTAQVGQTLTAANGTWSGTSPFTYGYQWSRCDANGKNCKQIVDATDNTYAPLQADIGSTLIITVQAKNSDGSDSQPSSPTAVVTAAPAPTGCPSGNGTIAIADLTSPAHLQINPGNVTPNPVTRDSASIQLKFTITACGSRAVQGALVYVTATPYNQFSIPAEATTDSNGIAVLTMNQLVGFPVSSKQQLLTIFVRARKDGEDLLGGISARRLVSFPVQLH
jgi:hypothetical protein